MSEMWYASGMKNLALLLLPLFTITFTQSVRAEPLTYIRSNGQFVANGSEYPRGFWLPAVRGADEVFRGNVVAYQEYLDHVADARWFSILNWGGLGAFLTYTLISASTDNYNGFVALGVLIVPWIGAAIMGTKSNRHLLKAMNLINGVPPLQARATFGSPSLPTARGVRSIPLLSWSF